MKTNIHFPKLSLVSSTSAIGVALLLIGGSQVSLAQTPLPAGCVAWWRGETNALDSVGTNHGIILGGLPYTNGMVGRGFWFNGADSGIRVPASPTLNVSTNGGMTFEVWMKPLNLGRAQTFFAYVPGGSWSYTEGLIAYHTPFTVWLSTSQGRVEIGSTTNLVLNQFQHLAVTYDNASGLARLYLNGSVVGSLVVGTNAAINTAGDFYLGYEPSYQFSGVLDEPALYNRALSSNEIAAIYQAGNAGKVVVKAPGMVSWWRAEGNGNDSIGTNHGTLLNGAGFAPGLIGQAFVFDGVDDGVQIPDSPSLSPQMSASGEMTLEAWIKMDELPGPSPFNVRHPVGKHAPPEYGFGVFTNGAPAFAAWGVDGQGIGANGPPITLNAWHHFVGTFKRTGQIRLYVDGLLKQQTNVISLNFQDTASSFWIGRLSEGYCFKGLVDEVALYNRELTSNEVAAIYQADGAGRITLSYNPVTAFTNQPGPPPNPNGVWSYGWAPNDFSHFTLNTNSGSPYGPYWSRGGGGDPPSIWLNQSWSSLPFGYLYMLPASSGEASVLRWTSPASGNAHVVGRFLAGDSASTAVEVRLNNASWWSATDAGDFDLSTTISQGGTIDFLVSAPYGSGRGDTPLEAVITLFPPSATPPTISVHPRSQTNVIGSSATFTAKATGTAPLAYQWRRGSAPISGATTSSYALNNVQLSDSGSQFSVVVTNAYGATTSQVATLTVTTCAQAPGIVFEDFADASSLQLNGTTTVAATADGAVLQLTTATNDQSGSAFLKSPVCLADNASFSTFFAFRLSQGGGLVDKDGIAGADGIVFVVQTVANNVGGSGGGIGYAGITNSVGVEFDTWYNTNNPATDPLLPGGQLNPNGSPGDGNHVAVDLNGVLNSAASVHVAEPFNGGQVGYAWVDYNGVTQTLEVRVSQGNARPVLPTLAYSVNLLAYLGTPVAYVGFTAATGGSWNQQDILTWELKTSYEPIGITIVQQPQSRTNVVGSSAMFTVAASGPTPLGYQWRFHGTNLANGVRISGATGTNLTIANVQLADAGNYSVVVTNAYDSVTSQLAVLSVFDPVSTVQMSTPRRVHTATLLPNGKVLVVGGWTNSNATATTASTELYDPATGAWFTAASLGTARGGHTATLLANGKVLVAGGYHGSLGYLASAELYDPVANTWTPTGPMATTRADFTATLLPNGKVLAAGGSYWTSVTYTPRITAELYDPATGAWTSTASLPAARGEHQAALLPNGQVLIVGGTTDGRAGLATTALYNPTNGTWSASGSLTEGRFYHTATALADGKVLTAAGYHNQHGVQAIASAELFNPATGTWAVAGSLHTVRYYHRATLLADGKLLVTGGVNTNMLASAELFDPTTSAWAEVPPLLLARHTHTATLLPDGKVLIAGGVTKYATDMPTAHSELLSTITPSSASSECQNLDDNQVPAGWTLSKPHPNLGDNYGVAGGRLYANPVNGAGCLRRPLSFTAPIKSVRMQWRGWMQPNYWGMFNEGYIFLSSGASVGLSFWTKQYQAGGNPVTEITSQGRATASGTWALTPAESGVFRYNLLLEKGRCSVEVRRDSDGSLFSSYATNHASFDPALATNVWFGANCTSDAGTWIDDLCLEVQFEAVSECYDLNNNQVPAGWTLTQRGAAGIGDGRLYANPTDNWANLSRAFMSANGVSRVKMEWTGYMTDSLWGIANHAWIQFSDGKNLWGVSERKSFYWGSGHVAYVGPDYVEGTGAGAPYSLVAGENGEFRHALILQEGSARFELRRVANGQLYNSFTTNLSYIRLNSITNVAFRATTTGQNSWMDDLCIEVEFGNSAPQPLAVLTTDLPAGTVGVAYNQTLVPVGGVTPYTWSLISGALPAGLSLSAGGVIGGMPTVIGTNTFTVQVRDALNTNATKEFWMVVSPAPLAITTTELPAGIVGQSYSRSLSASGGVLPYNWSIASGTLPAGLTLGSGGTLSGVPAAAGTVTVTIQVRDAQNTTTSRAFSLTISPAPLVITTTSLPPGGVGQTYNQALSASGGVLPYTWSLVSGTLPAGLSLSGSGSVSGTPTAAGSSAFRVQVAATGVSPAQKDLEIVVTNPVTGSLTFAMGSATNLQGAEVVIPVTASQFQGVAAFQFSTHWNAAVAQFVALEQLGLPGLAAGSFGTNLAANGTATVSWDDPDGVSKTLTNGAVLFALRLKLIGAPGATSSLTIDGMPTAIEAVDEGLWPLPVATVSGTLKILDRISIGGTIRYYDLAKTVPGTTLALSGSGQQTTSSSAAGTYLIGDINVGGNYTLTPSRLSDSPIAQGVTSADILMIRRQILGIAALDSPHKLLAADVNGSSTVSTVDITYLRRFILGNTNSLPAGLWRFVPSDHAFPNPASPWTAPKARSYAGLITDQTGQDFLAIKLGDVNNSWLWSGTKSGTSVPKGGNGPKSNGHVTFAAGSGSCGIGQEVVIPITVYGFTNVTSAQFTLQWDAALLDYLGVGTLGLTDLTAGNFGTNHIAVGKLTLAWDDPSLAGVSVANGAAIFTVTFRARTGAGGSSPLTFTDDPTVREVTVNAEVVEFASVEGHVAIAAGAQPPQLALRLEGGKPVLTITATAGTRVEIQRVGTLTGMEWTKLDEVVVGSASLDWTDQSTSGDSSKFYRVKALP